MGYHTIPMLSCMRFHSNAGAVDLLWARNQLLKQGGVWQRRHRQLMKSLCLPLAENLRLSMSQAHTVYKYSHSEAVCYPITAHVSNHAKFVPQGIEVLRQLWPTKRELCLIQPPIRWWHPRLAGLFTRGGLLFDSSEAKKLTARIRPLRGRGEGCRQQSPRLFNKWE